MYLKPQQAALHCSLRKKAHSDFAAAIVSVTAGRCLCLGRYAWRARE